MPACVGCRIADAYAASLVLLLLLVLLSRRPSRIQHARCRCMLLLAAHHLYTQTCVLRPQALSCML